MKPVYVVAFVIIALALGGVSRAAVEAKPMDFQSMVKNDTDLTDRIGQDLLAEEKLPRKDWENIQVAVKGGTVTLKGMVSLASQKKLVGEIAKQSGAEKVINLLQAEDEFSP